MDTHLSFASSSLSKDPCFVNSASRLSVTSSSLGVGPLRAMGAVTPRCAGFSPVAVELAILVQCASLCTQLGMKAVQRQKGEGRGQKRLYLEEGSGGETSTLTSNCGQASSECMEQATRDVARARVFRTFQEED